LTVSGFASQAKAAALRLLTRVVDEITERFWLLAQFPWIGRKRDDDLSPGLRGFAVGDYVVIHRVESDEVVLILHVVHGSRDIVALLKH
jgi:plasmid stabilization system protein ParE